MKRLFTFILLLGLASAAFGSVTNCAVTIDLTNKTISVAGVVAIRETVNVALLGVGSSAPSNLTLRITKGTNVYAQSTNGAFSVVGTNGTGFGQLDLNTSELVTDYSGMNPLAVKSWSIGVWDSSLGTLLVNDLIEIQNNPYDPSMPGPSPVGVYYMETANTNYSYRVHAGNLQLWDVTDNAWRDVMFRHGLVVAGSSNVASSTPTNLVPPDRMGVMMAYSTANPPVGYLLQYSGDGLFELVPPGVGTNGAGLLAEIADRTNADAILQTHIDTVRAEGSNETIRAVGVETGLEARVITLEGEVSALQTNTYGLFRYAVIAGEVEVLASATNVTAVRAGTVITVSIPIGVRVSSLMIRWDGGNGSSFSLAMGTNDMHNASAIDRWGALFQAYREDTGSLIPGAQARLDTSNFGTLLISGMSVDTINHCRFGF